MRELPERACGDITLDDLQAAVSLLRAKGYTIVEIEMGGAAWDSLACSFAEHVATPGAPFSPSIATFPFRPDCGACLLSAPVKVAESLGDAVNYIVHTKNQLISHKSLSEEMHP